MNCNKSQLFCLFVGAACGFFFFSYSHSIHMIIVNYRNLREFTSLLLWWLCHFGNALLLLLLVLAGSFRQ